MVTKRYHHQYSLRRARPEKVAYLLRRTLLTAWLNDMTRSWSEGTASGRTVVTPWPVVGEIPAIRAPGVAPGTPGRVPFVVRDDGVQRQQPRHRPSPRD